MFVSVYMTSQMYVSIHWFVKCITDERGKESILKKYTGLFWHIYKAFTLSTILSKYKLY